MNKKDSGSFILVILTFLINLCILYLDYLSPRGYLEWFAYLAPILFFAPRLSKKYIILITILSSVFILIGFAISHPGLTSGISFVNRVIGIVILISASAIQIQRNNYRIQLQSLITERETLLKEIHHRVKNNFQMISSLLNLQLSRNNDPEIIDLLKISKSHIYSMTLVHEKLYKSENLSEIKSGEYIKEIAMDLFNIYNMGDKISLQTNIHDIPLSSSTAFLLGLIINETISNSFKYAFPDNTGGEISISLQDINNNYLQLIIKDNGVGFQQESKKNKSSLGMELISSFAKQLDGKLEIKIDKGVELSLIFKVDNRL